MKSVRWIQALFIVAALYDGVLGIVFLAVPAMMYDAVNLTHPNHWGYIRFPAALLILFALMFAAIARNPVGNRNLIPYGIGLKVCYCAVAFSYWAMGSLPWIWQPFAIIDLVMMGLFTWAWLAIPVESVARRQPGAG